MCRDLIFKFFKYIFVFWRACRVGRGSRLVKHPTPWTTTSTPWRPGAACPTITQVSTVVFVGRRFDSSPHLTILNKNSLATVKLVRRYSMQTFEKCGGVLGEFFLCVVKTHAIRCNCAFRIFANGAGICAIWSCWTGIDPVTWGARGNLSNWQLQ